MGLDQTYFESLLGPAAFGRPFHYFESTDSTNTRARELALGGAPEGALVLADAQSAGRGRFGKAWASAEGENLLFSLVLRPAPGAVISQLPLVLGLGLSQALRLPGLCLKWPNDLMVDGRKLSGLLVEGAGDALIAGMGINVNQRAFDPALNAVSLAQILGDAQDREATLAALLASIELAYRSWQASGFGPFKAAWEAKACFMGSRVRAGSLEGTVLGLAEDGGLRLRTASGEAVLRSGEVEGLREAP
jgi:BirA family biotin operon repressor/biotin-[acetyl-CoA-carboxylase] ligase